MPKQALLPAVLIAVFLLAAYFFLRTNSTTVVSNEATIPFAILPFCDDDDRVITLLEDGTIICLGKASIYALQSGARTKISDLSKNETILTGTLGYFIGYSASQVTLYRVMLPLTIEKVYDFALNDQITPISSFISKSEQGTHVFVSAQKEATSATSIKSMQYKITLQNSGAAVPTNPILTTLATPEMLRVIDSYYDGTVLLMRELYPFLAPKFRIALWSESPAILSPHPAITAFVTSTDQPLYFSDDENAYLLSQSGAKSNVTTNNILASTIISTPSGFLSLDTSNSSLIWNPSSQASDPTSILAHIPTTQLELTGRYSTRIGKRVYNCFDFSESLQITLRACIPQL